MAGRRAKPPRAVERVVPVEVTDTQTDRALNRVRDELNRLARARLRDVIEGVDLVQGVNKISHGLGRPPAGYTLVASVADNTFAHAMRRDNPQPERTIWIEVRNLDMDNCTLEVW